MEWGLQRYLEALKIFKGLVVRLGSPLSIKLFLENLPFLFEKSLNYKGNEKNFIMEIMPRFKSLDSKIYKDIQSSFVRYLQKIRMTDEVTSNSGDKIEMESYRLNQELLSQNDKRMAFMVKQIKNERKIFETFRCFI